jgi:hypothetical protein
MMRKEGFGRIESLPASRYSLRISVRRMRKSIDTLGSVKIAYNSAVI